MSLRVPFLFARQTTASLMEQYDAMYSNFRKGNLSTIERIKFSSLNAEISKRLEVVEVTPEAKNDDLIAQMAGQDVVHAKGAATSKELIENRLGGDDSTKTAYALIDPASRKVFSAIYVFRGQTPLVDDIVIDEVVQGNVAEVLNDKPESITREVTSNIFYSITGFGVMRGEGEMLINKLHTKLNNKYKDKPDVVFSTLSPDRKLVDWFKHEGIDYLKLTKDQLAEKALDYLWLDHSELPKDLQDGVRRFHLSNGAEVGGIRLEANEKGSLDDVKGAGVMINYIYPRSVRKLKQNMQSFKDGIVALYDGLRVPEHMVPKEKKLQAGI